MGLCGEISLITSFLSSHHIRLDRSSPDYFLQALLDFLELLDKVSHGMYVHDCFVELKTDFGTSVWAYQV